MTKLTYFREQKSSAGAAKEYIRMYIGHARLRIANVNNDTHADTVSLAIVDRNLTDTAVQTISLFQGQAMVASTIDVGWEGDIEIGIDQDLIATFEGSGAADTLYLTVGAELL